MGMHLERIQDWETLARVAGHKPKPLARLVRASVRLLERHFKKSHGCTPRVWLSQTRLRHAAELLRAGGTNKEIASAVGLKTDSSLCHFFQQAAGCTPQEYLAFHEPHPSPHPSPPLGARERDGVRGLLSARDVSHFEI